MEIDRAFKMRARRADLSMGYDKIELYAFQKDSHTFFAARKLELIQTERTVTLNPFIEIELHEAQILMDDLWEAGVRPTEGSGSAGAMKAVQNHLEDMRKITFKKIGIFQ